MDDLTPERLRELLILDPDTGKLYWRERPTHIPTNKQWNGKHAGKEAFTHCGKRGYLRGSIFNKLYTAHRIVFAIHTGEWPVLVDHINGDKTDNRPANLRAATPSQNLQNQGLSKRNTSGVRGVFWDKKRRRWCAQIAVNRKRMHIGSFMTCEDAAKARENAQLIYHNGFDPAIEAGVYRLESIQAGIL